MSLLARLLVLKDSLIVVFCVFLGAFLAEMTPAKKDMRGKNAIVTGSSSGIGQSIALQLAQARATVYLACRNLKKAAKARDEILNVQPDADVRVMQLDTASFASIRAFAVQWKDKPIDVLAHNAGTATNPEEAYTADGLHSMYQTNALGPFLLTKLLDRQLAGDARIIFTSSAASVGGKLTDHFSLKRVTNAVEPDFHVAGAKNDDMPAYSNSKLMQVTLAKVMQQHYRRDPATRKRLVFAYEPGLVRTPMADDLLGSKPGDDAVRYILGMLHSYAITPSQGAATAVHLAMSDDPDVLGHGGAFYSRMKPRHNQAETFSQDKLDKLWIRWCADADISWT